MAPYARLTRALIISIKRRPYIEAVQLMGAGRPRIMRRHLIPAALGPVLVYATADAGFIVVSVATLSFLGLGVRPPTPEWGQMLVAGSLHGDAPGTRHLSRGWRSRSWSWASTSLGEAWRWTASRAAPPSRRLARRRAEALA